MKTVKIGQNDYNTEAIISPKNLNDGAQHKIIGADTTLNYEFVQSKNNTQSILKQLPKNFEKSQFGAKIPLISRLPATTCETVNRFFFIKSKLIQLRKEIVFLSFKKIRFLKSNFENPIVRFHILWPKIKSKRSRNYFPMHKIKFQGPKQTSIFQN